MIIVQGNIAQEGKWERERALRHFRAYLDLTAGGVLAVFTLLLFFLLNRGGKRLEASGREKKEERREQALVQGGNAALAQLSDDNSKK